jgi:hypothetical protein
MRKIFFAAFALLAVAVGPVRGQDMTAPRDFPAARLDELRKRTAPVNLDEMRRRCSVLVHTAPQIPYPDLCYFSCGPDDRVCEVINKMHGRVRDDVRWLIIRPR